MVRPRSAFLLMERSPVVGCLMIDLLMLLCCLAAGCATVQNMSSSDRMRPLLWSWLWSWLWFVWSTGQTEGGADRLDIGMVDIGMLQLVALSFFLPLTA